MNCACGHDEHGRQTMVCFTKGCPCMQATVDAGQWAVKHGIEHNDSDNGITDATS